eukprot:evm.model.scf_1977.4 EVM.evm.TU.scf_1977.4   scf_1977:17868-24238(+)
MAAATRCRSALLGAARGLGRHALPPPEWAIVRAGVEGVRKIAIRRCAHRPVIRACSSSNGVDATKERFTVTTPLYYVNAEPHMGTAYPTIAADVIARYQRLQGKEVMFVTGMDEHGEKIALAAEKGGKEPKQHCDDIWESFMQLWEQLNIEADSVVRTTSASHEKVAIEVLERVWQKGDIYLDQYEGWYCVDCEEYKDDTEMQEGHTCGIHQRECKYMQEENYFFRLSKYQKEVEDLVINNSDFVQPAIRRNEVVGWVKSGLKDFSISRLSVDWGIRLPRNPKHTLYVWFDALNGYLSGLLPEGEDATLQNAVRKGWPASVHIIGKDILRFHAVYWPAMLMSAGLPLPDKIYGHGFLTKDGLKMGKSVGNVLDASALVQAYGADAVRYYFMREIPFGQDGDFSEQRFRDIVNANLANDIGNLLNRTLNLLYKNCDGVIPVAAVDISTDNPLRAIAQKKPQEVALSYERFAFGAACEAIFAISGRGNQFLEETAPWAAFKTGTDGQRAFAGQVLVSVLEAVRIVAVMLLPITPSLAKGIYTQLGFDDAKFQELSWNDAQWGGLQSGHKISKPSPVFKRLEGDFVTEPPPAAVSSG